MAASTTVPASRACSRHPQNSMCWSHGLAHSRESGSGRCHPCRPTWRVDLERHPASREHAWRLATQKPRRGQGSAWWSRPAARRPPTSTIPVGGTIGVCCRDHARSRALVEIANFLQWVSPLLESPQYVEFSAHWSDCRQNRCTDSIRWNGASGSRLRAGPGRTQPRSRLSCWLFGRSASGPPFLRRASSH